MANLTKNGQVAARAVIDDIKAIVNELDKLADMKGPTDAGEVQRRAARARQLSDALTGIAAAQIE
jgi:hypothetical protein